MAQALPLAGATPSCTWIEVSPEMTAMIGAGPCDGVPLPPQPIAITFTLGSDVEPAGVHFGRGPAGQPGHKVVLHVASAALVRLGGRLPLPADRLGYHLPSELRSILLALRQGPQVDEARTVYRLGKSLELLCETIAAQTSGKLVPLGTNGALSPDDTRRLIAARRLIDERWSEKLTLDVIARACGLNRAKLTKGFKDLFDCTIAEALAEKRLSHARRMLLTTDKPVSSIGYENGYLNNASFARAFSRRFGVAPSSMRLTGAAA